MIEQNAFFQIAPVICFFLVFVLQHVYFKRRQHFLSARKATNLVLFACNALLFRLLLPISLSMVAVFAQQHQLGVLSSQQGWLGVVLGFCLLDLAVYWQHVAMHKVSWLWLLHQVHHTDKQMDVSTALRFHPLELLVSYFFKALVVLLLGAPVLAVLLFELMLLVGAQFSHSNWRLHNKVDKAMRFLVVTPDMHRVHHSIFREEHDSNYGFFFSFWDKLFKTYSEKPKKGHINMQIGLAQFEKELNIKELFVLPFDKKRGIKNDN